MTTVVSPAAERRLGVAGVVVSASSVQIGAAVGATGFPLVGPIGVAAMRQFVAAVALLVVTRPKLRGLGLRRIAPALVLGVALCVMNITLYEAVDRIGLGLAVTVEFTGPLAVSLIASHRARDAACGVLALAGVATLTGAFGGSRPNPAGVLLALAAAVAWAAYILLTARVGRTLPGVTGATLASCVASVLTLPVLIGELVGIAPAILPRVLVIGLVTGLLSNAFPYALDLVLLRHLPRSLFGMLQSVHPVAAAVFGLLVLGQHLTGLQVAAIAAVCLANALAVAGHRAAPPPRAPRAPRAV